jgi:hypothetical protein
MEKEPMNDQTGQTTNDKTRVESASGVFADVLESYNRMIFGDDYVNQTKADTAAARERAEKLTAEAERRAEIEHRRHDFKARCDMAQVLTITITVAIAAFLTLAILGRIALFMWVPS